MTPRFFKALMTGAVMAAGISGAASAAECIAPANPGGGWDFTCRQIGKIMFDIGAVDKPIQVTNMPGAGGGLAYNHVVAERNDDADLIVAASSATSTRLAQNAYAGHDRRSGALCGRHRCRSRRHRRWLPTARSSR